ncbi:MULTISPECIES: hypothetical protein [unclassified Streptomyces]|uniref:hypothetical protein n=1 Tax=unclassified Streptomyces TaxID=2593676 RepID=UPI0006AE025F|nr:MULTISPECIES: hypothetical protein [unclassified Streptomyces]KOX31602.1 hypothetical protein ADL06_10830 [Streptomyces sp. NRRL F-6491]KOX48060.1 hypothetical protein ADL08_11400 [Streptomyces sp. NRRL F-6492]
MSLEWDGFRLFLGSEGLVFSWAGGGYLEAGATNCVSALIHPPGEAGGRHRLVFRFRFPGTAAGAESVVVRVDVPPGMVDPAQRFVDLLWREYSVPDRAGTEDGAGAGPEPAAEAGPGIPFGTEEAPATTTDAGTGTEPEPEPGSEGEAGAGAVTGEAELARVPDAPGWIVSPAGPRSEELFRDVMTRPANSDR